ncbi:MAG: S-layer homology domain-containing protein [Clostridia bacterium]|nr:S-layer homology domain-containing protein [Clostridia bacterium]
MKRTHLRGIVLLLILSILLQTGVSAAERRETIAGLEIPDTWAHDALVFAVKEGILSGKGDKGLCPTDNATRAEMAAMIVRVLGAKPQEKPMSFSDCPQTAWYYESMSAAVGLGIISGTSDLTLSPKDNTTREQAFTILARAFRLSGGDKAVLKNYTDGDLVGSYAKDAMATMIEKGYVHGSKGKLNPKKNITRQELAQVLYEILDDILREEDEAGAEYQNLLYAGSMPFPERTVIHGDLIIPCDAPLIIDLTTVTVEGRLIVLGDCTVSGGTIAEAELLANCTLTGTIGTLTLSKNGISVDIEGSAERTVITARHATLQGLGNAGDVVNYGVGSNVICTYESCEECIDAGLDGVSIIQETFPTASYKQRTVQVTVRFDHVDNEHLFGVSGDRRMCSIKWYFNGTKVSESNFELSHGSEQSAAFTIPFSRQMPDSFPVSVRLTYGSETISIPIQIKIDKTNLDAYCTAVDIPTIHVLATINYNCTTSDGRSLKRGDTVYYIKDGNCIQIPGSSRYTTIPSGAFQIVNKTYHNSSVSYSQTVAEAFVNNVHDYSSRTKYLLWCNLYTQTVFIFQGDKGNWKLLMQSPCASGANSTPTRPGVYSVTYKSTKLDYVTYYAAWFTAFDNGIGFHSRLKYTSDGSWYDSRIGFPLSHGCLRLYDDVAKYIYDNCTYGTTVVVW